MPSGFDARPFQARFWPVWIIAVLATGALSTFDLIMEWWELLNFQQLRDLFQDPLRRAVKSISDKALARVTQWACQSGLVLRLQS